MNQNSQHPYGVKYGGVVKGKELWILPSGESFLREIGQGPGTPWADVSHETRLNDMRSLTLWGKQGTSEGDSWDPRSIDAARKIVGKSSDVSDEHIRRFMDWMARTGNMAFMGEHPGKQAYTPEYFGQGNDGWLPILIQLLSNTVGGRR